GTAAAAARGRTVGRGARRGALHRDERPAHLRGRSDRRRGAGRGRDPIRALPSVHGAGQVARGDRHRRRPCAIAPCHRPRRDRLRMSSHDIVDILIREALIIDGSGTEPFAGDVLVRSGRIAEVTRAGGGPPVGGGAATGSIRPGPGTRVIEAGGLALAPGFIDMHAHSDLAVLTDGEHRAKTLQGVTTEVIGQDGLAYAPVTDESMPIIREQIAGWNGIPDDIDFSWRSVADYLAEIDRRGTATDVAFLLPQGTIRMDAVGLEDRPATTGEIERMREVIAQGMREGAFGLSSGLTYVPGMFAGTDELVTLCEVV